MNNKYTLEQLFSAPVYNSRVNLNIKPYLNLCLKEKRRLNNDNYDGEKWENTSAGSKNKYVLEKKQFKDLKNEILKHVNIYGKDILEYSNDFKITTSWISFTDPNCKAHLHRHRNCVFSGIVYLQTEENSGNLVFEDYKNLNDIFLNIKNYNIFNSELWYYKPFNSKIIIFPSHLFHRIDKNKSKIIRVSIAFNVMPYGAFGEGDSSLVI